MSAPERVPPDEARAALRKEARAVRDQLIAALREARRWIGDGDMADGLHRDHWTRDYAAVVDQVDAALARCQPDQEPQT